MPLRSHTPSFQPGRDNSLCQTITAFVDLLGLSNSLVLLDNIQAQALSQDQALELVRSSHGVISKLRREFESFYDLFESGPPPTDLPSDQAELWALAQRDDTCLYWFSDCGLINVLVDTANVAATCRGALKLLVGLSVCTIGLAQSGQLLRGGVEMGVGLDRGGTELLGSGLVHAYRLETRVATYPRICIGGQFMTFLSACETEAGLAELGISPRERRIVFDQVQFIRDLVTVDPDGVPRVHFTSRWVTSILSSGGRESLLPDARVAIESKMRALDVNTAPELYMKYAWMRSALGGTSG